MNERMTDGRREELRRYIDRQYLRPHEAEEVNADWDRARAEEARLLEEVKKQEERARLLEAFGRLGLAAYHGHLCEMSRGPYPENARECTDKTCREWAKAVSP